MTVARVPLGDVADFINGVAFRPADWEESGRRIIRIQNLTDSTKPFNRTNRAVAKKYEVAPGDLLVSWSATLGVFVWDEPDIALVNQHIFRVEPDNKRIDQDYLRHMLADALIEMKRHLHGATMKHVNRREFLATSIPLPPLAEQKRIAGVLDAADALRAKRRESLAQLDTLLQSTFLDMFGDPVTNPMGWATGTLEDVTKKITDGTHKTPKYTDSGVEFLSAKDLKDGKVRWDTGKFISPEEHAKLIKRCNPEPGDLLLAKSGSLGSVAIIDRVHEFSLFESLCLIKRNPEKIGAPFLSCMIRNPTMQIHLLGKNKGVAVKHLHLVDVRSLKIVIPPLSQQERFAAIAEAVEQQKASQRAHLAELDTLFASLQSRAFRGNL